MIDYSIIIPVYCNSQTINELYETINEKVLKKNIKLVGQVVFCDDGSSDNSFEKLIQLKSKYSSIKIIKLTRNFGQVPAIYSGLTNIESKCYIVISADLQDPIDLMNQFLLNHVTKKYDIVGAERVIRDDSWLSKIGPKIFYTLIRKLNFPNYPPGGFDYFLISKRVRDEIIRMNQANSFLQGEILNTGYKAKFIPYRRLKRLVGKSKWTFSKKITYFIDGILGYSFFPLRLMTVSGILIFFFAMFFSFYIIFSKFIGYGTFPLGWTTLVILILFLNSTIMVFLGIIGEYLWRTLSQTRKKPKYVIDKLFD